MRKVVGDAGGGGGGGGGVGDGRGSVAGRVVVAHPDPVSPGIAHVEGAAEAAAAGLGQPSALEELAYNTITATVGFLSFLVSLPNEYIAIRVRLPAIMAQQDAKREFLAFFLVGIRHPAHLLHMPVQKGSEEARPLLSLGAKCGRMSRSLPNSTTLAPVRSKRVFFVAGYVIVESPEPPGEDLVGDVGPSGAASAGPRHPA
ncbi:Protein of unknown function [Gryllus bimaculatus]|nr:Protein of unknown function [Gryllus bimaculatus]